VRQIEKGSTNQSIDVYIIDSTTGLPELGVAFDDAGMDLEYRREGSFVVNITEVTLALLTTAWASGGFLEIGHGYYRLDVPDAAFATGAESVSVQGTLTGMIILPQTIQLITAGAVLAASQPNAITFAERMTWDKGIVIDQSITNQAAIKATGNALGSGMDLSGGSNNGHGLILRGNGTASGLRALGGSAGPGISSVGTGAAAGLEIIGGATGAGISATGDGGAAGIVAQGEGAGAGINAIGGATGNGLSGTGGASGGSGINAQSQSGAGGIRAASSGGGAGFNISSTTGLGMVITAGGSNDGLQINGGAAVDINAAEIIAIKAVTDALTVVAAAKLALSAAGIISGVAEGTPTTTSMDTDLSGFADDELINGAIVWTGGTAAGQRAKITDYANTNGVVSYAAIATAPVATDPFVIV